MLDKQSILVDRIFNTYHLFRIEFSDESQIKMTKLLEPILIEKKFKAIPKMVVTQFCRGRSMHSTTVVDRSGPETSGLTNEINGQACFFKISITTFVKA